MRKLSAQTIPIENLEDPKVKAFSNTKFFLKDCKQFPQDATLGQQNHFPQENQFFLSYGNPHQSPLKLNPKNENN